MAFLSGPLTGKAATGEGEPAATRRVNGEPVKRSMPRAGKPYVLQCLRFGLVVYCLGVHEQMLASELHSSGNPN